METTPSSADGPSSVSELHKKIEAMKVAYADLYRYDADPRFAKVPVKGLLSKEYAKDRAGVIDPNKAHCNPAPGKPPASETTYLTAVDHEGNIVSLIQSNYAEFGSGITVRGMGFALQDRGALFSLDADSPNVLAPRKRPFHTIIPAFMEKGDQHIGFGIMGGPNQPLAHAQFVSNIVDYGMNIQAALENPRFTVTDEGGCTIAIESRVPAAVRDKLTSRGHNFRVDREYSTHMLFRSLNRPVSRCSFPVTPTAARFFPSPGSLAKSSGSSLRASTATARCRSTRQPAQVPGARH